MLRAELLAKMRASHERMANLSGEHLDKEKAVFAALNEEVNRLDVVVQREAELVSQTERDDTQLWAVFGQLLRGEEVSDVGRTALAIREQSLQDKAGPEGFRAPGNACDYFAQPVRRTTTTCAPGLGTISSDISGMIPNAALAEFVQMPLPPAPLFDKATKIAAINGVAVPFMVQTAADPFAGVTIFKNPCEGTDKDESDPPAVSQEPITTTEYEAYCVVSDLALRRAPNYEGIISNVFKSALAFTVNADIITALNADAGVVTVPRAVVLQVSWPDLIDLQGGIPYFWAVNGEYAMCQDAQTFLKRTLTAAPGYPMYTGVTSQAMYTALNGRPFFLDDLPNLGLTGDVFYGDYAGIYVGVGQDIVFSRTNEGLTLKKANSTAFFVFAHLGIGIPVGEAFAKLGADVATTTTTGL